MALALLVQRGRRHGCHCGDSAVCLGLRPGPPATEASCVHICPHLSSSTLGSTDGPLQEVEGDRGPSFGLAGGRVYLGGAVPNVFTLVLGDVGPVTLEVHISSSCSALGRWAAWPFSHTAAHIHMHLHMCTHVHTRAQCTLAHTHTHLSPPHTTASCRMPVCQQPLPEKPSATACLLPRCPSPCNRHVFCGSRPHQGSRRKPGPGPLAQTVATSCLAQWCPGP